MSFLKLAEDQLVNVLSGNVSGVTVTAGVNVTDKTYPLIVCSAEQAQEAIGVGSGIYRIPMNIVYEAKADDTSPTTFDDNWQDVMECIYGTTINDSMATTGFHVYGHVYGQQTHVVDSGERLWQRQISFDIMAMPRDND